MEGTRMAIGKQEMHSDVAAKQQQWQDYVLHGIVSEETRQEVLKSWQRCKEHHLSATQMKPRRIYDALTLSRIQEENRKLMEISEPIMQTISQFISGSGFIIALADRNGVILRLMGDESMMDAVRDGGFVEGADWSEGSAGSNAIGTALVIRKPIQFCGYEHFCTFTQRTACSSAPIRSPEGALLGVIDLTGRFKSVNDHTLGMAVAMAAAIENCLRISRAEQSYRTENLYKAAVMESISDGLLTVDGQGVITHINRMAADFLKIPQNSVGSCLRDLLPENNQQLYAVLDLSESCTDRELHIMTEEGKLQVMATARPVLDQAGHIFGTVLVMSEINRAKRIARKFSNLSAPQLTFSDLLGQNQEFKRTIDAARMAARSNSSILLLGESGTGKDVCAQAIHNGSFRANGPFVSINCGAIPKELIASELFGYVEGAFTGARRGGSVGKFEQADGGTLFLDEIGEMPLDLQVHLLRVLEQRSLTRLGGNELIPVDVRIIAATNKNLEAEVEAGNFRRDLYYRLNVITLRLPPLRERKDDIPLLTAHFYQRFHPGKTHIPPDYQRILLDYSWPGNIRELRNIIERTVSLSPTGELDVNCLPTAMRHPVHQTLLGKASLAAMERSMLQELIRSKGGNLTQVAEELGIARTTLYRRMKKYGLDRPAGK